MVFSVFLRPAASDQAEPVPSTAKSPIDKDALGSGKYVHIGCLLQHFTARGDWHNFKCPTCQQPYEGKALRCLAQSSVVLLQRTLAIQEKHCGVGHISTATTLNNLASAYTQLSDVVQAREMMERSVAIEEQHFGKGHVPRGAGLAILASIYADLAKILGDDHMGKELLQEALAIEENHVGPELVETAIILNNIALVCGEVGDLQSMKKYLERSLEAKDANLGIDHQDSSLTLAYLAIACAALDEIRLAWTFTHRALAACKQGVSLHSLRHSFVLMHVAITHRALGEASKAEEFVSSALRILVHSLGLTSAARTLKRERNRASRIWSSAGRQDVLNWLDVALSSEKLCEDPQVVFPSLEVSVGLPNVPSARPLHQLPLFKKGKETTFNKNARKS